MSTSAAPAPRTEGQAFRFRATGRLWKLEGESPGGLIRLINDFFGAENYVRVYVSAEELSEDYEPVMS